MSDEIRPMTDEERQRAKKKAMANKEQRDEDKAMSDDLVKQLQNPRPMSMFLTRADQAKDWTELLHTAADRIEELSNCVAVLEAKHQEAFQMYVDANEARIDAEAERDALAERLAKAVELLGQWRLASAGHVSLRSVIDKHDATLVELKGGKDE